jgi:hypothetical protein
MAELITQRIRRNASELRLHAIAEDPDELIERAEAAQLGYREFLDLLLESEVGVRAYMDASAGSARARPSRGWRLSSRHPHAMRRLRRRLRPGRARPPA